MAARIRSRNLTKILDRAAIERVLQARHFVEPLEARNELGAKVQDFRRVNLRRSRSQRLPDCCISNQAGVVRQTPSE